MHCIIINQTYSPRRINEIRYSRIHKKNTRSDNDGKNTDWVPKSQCEWDEKDKTMQMPEWLAISSVNCNGRLTQGHHALKGLKKILILYFLLILNQQGK